MLACHTFDMIGNIPTWSDDGLLLLLYKTIIKIPLLLLYATICLTQTDHVSGTVYWRQFATQHYQLLYFLILFYHLFV